MELTAEQAGIGILCCVIASDGQISDPESELISFVTHRHPLFRNLPTDEVGQAIKTNLDRIVEHSATGWAAACAARVPAEQRLTIFALAADLAYSDSELRKPEIEVLQALQEAFEIAPDHANNIVGVVACKNGVL